jgi:F0F1-type ATP synthase assembly protein I
MSDDKRPPKSASDAAWNVPAYLLAGIILYGGIGFALDRWLGTSWLVLVGMLVGAALALYLIWVRYGTR